MTQINTDEIRQDWCSFMSERAGVEYRAALVVRDLCDELDKTRAALEAQRQLHANLLAHLRSEDRR